MPYFLNLPLFVISFVNLSTEFKHLIKLVRRMPFNLKHSTTQYGIQNKPRGAWDLDV